MFGRETRYFVCRALLFKACVCVPIIMIMRMRPAFGLQNKNVGIFSAEAALAVAAGGTRCSKAVGQLRARW